MKRYVLEIIVFICGAVLMILELVGARIFAPYLGTSNFVWTSLIGIILGSLSLGYWLGGKMADRKASHEIFSFIIFSGAVYIGIIPFFDRIILNWVTSFVNDIRIGAVIASFALFAAPGVLFGMISPYAVKLRMNALDSSGRVVGNLYAVSTVGSITGTFLTGFYLIPSFGSRNILLFLSILLILTSFMAYTSRVSAGRLGMLVLIILAIVIENYIGVLSVKAGFIDVDTEYNRVLIYDDADWNTGKPVRRMQLGNEYSSAMFLDESGLVYEYTKYYRMAEHFVPGFKNALMIGGAAYSYPKDYLKRYPEARLDVVEIDPKLTELAERYFNLEKNERLTVYHQDARIFINNTRNKYDVVLGDAFKSMYALPYQLTTREAVQKTYDILNQGGAAIINIISAIEGEKGEFLRAEYATYRSVFPQVYLFSVEDKNDGLMVQNIMLVALKSDVRPEFVNADRELNGYLQHLWTNEVKDDMPVLTDDHAPVEHYIMKLLKK